jgi:hypothetical protein
VRASVYLRLTARLYDLHEILQSTDVYYSDKSQVSKKLPFEPTYDLGYTCRPADIDTHTRGVFLEV